MPPKIALDSNIIIDTLRYRGDEERLTAFHERFAPWEYLSSIVALELLAGARSDADASRVEQHLLAPFERRGRVFAPSHATWKAAGVALAKLRGATASRAFHHDVLLAASCREHGVTLVTRNARDFARIRRVLRFDYRVDLS